MYSTRNKPIIEEPLFHGVYSLLRSMGFEYKGSLKQSTDKNDESFLQADCIFIRRGKDE